MHDIANNHGGITWVIGIFFWVMILVGVVVFVRSAFRGSDK
jgi:hypothetical protein